jgi:hypothetical protein
MSDVSLFLPYSICDPESNLVLDRLLLDLGWFYPILTWIWLSLSCTGLSMTYSTDVTAWIWHDLTWAIVTGIDSDLIWRGPLLLSRTWSDVDHCYWVWPDLTWAIVIESDLIWRGPLLLSLTWSDVGHCYWVWPDLTWAIVIEPDLIWRGPLLLSLTWSDVGHCYWVGPDLTWTIVIAWVWPDLTFWLLSFCPWRVISARPVSELTPSQI